MQIVVGTSPFAMINYTVTVAGTYIVSAGASFQSYDNSGTMTFPEFYLYSGTKISSTWGPNNVYNAGYYANATTSSVRKLAANDIVYLYIAYNAKTGTTTFSDSFITLTRIA